VLDVVLPDDSEAPLAVRTFAACLASAAEVDLQQVPLPGTTLSQAIREWRSWLAGRGAGLVPIADPARFNWPGYWIAVLGEQSADPGADREKVAVLMFGTPAGVVLSPHDQALLGRPAADLAVEKGYLLASFDPTFIDPGRPSTLRGYVDSIAVAEVATGPMRLVDQAQAFAGRGLEGDRYAAKAGTFTPGTSGGRGYDLTLIEAEVLDQLLLPQGRRLRYAEARRNIITRGIDLNGLVGRRFRIGNVECLGQRLCEPCAHLERLTTKGVLRRLIHRGGLRADILSDGLITTSATIETTD
jgi:MOSC domain-containing protein YiiM